MLNLAASLLGITKFLREAALAAFRWALSHPWQTLCIVLLVAAAWQWRGKNEALEDVARWRATAAAEKASHEQTVRNYREASKLALAAAEAKKQAIEAEHKRIAEHAEQNYDALRRQYRNLLLRHTAKTDPSGANGAGVPERASASGVSHESASPAGFYISRSDGLRTADLGAYAVACYRWAEDVATSSKRPTEPRVSD